MSNLENIQCIVGLGNPGDKYRDTRHNAGFWFVDLLLDQLGGRWRSESKFFGDVGRVQIDGKNTWLLKPMTYMNRSGQSVSAFAKFYKLNPENFLVVHDDLDLDPGDTRLKKGGGHGGHNGLRDITSALSSKDFYRLRLGIGHPGHRDDVVDFVLSRAGKEETGKIMDSLREAERVLPECLSGDFQKAMNHLHRKV